MLHCPRFEFAFLCLSSEKEKIHYNVRFVHFYSNFKAWQDHCGHLLWFPAWKNKNNIQATEHYQVIPLIKPTERRDFIFQRMRCNLDPNIKSWMHKLDWKNEDFCKAIWLTHYFHSKFFNFEMFICSVYTL